MAGFEPFRRYTPPWNGEWTTQRRPTIPVVE
jgi:hypothetical protein